ncbi:hypothetical protein K1719_009647 [Acacia pycnantha]|nr:hypothetical protein K1719_009647 [Acacia pycnantha]
MVQLQTITCNKTPQQSENPSSSRTKHDVPLAHPTTTVHSSVISGLSFNPHIYTSPHFLTKAPVVMNTRIHQVMNKKGNEGAEDVLRDCPYYQLLSADLRNWFAWNLNRELKIMGSWKNFVQPNDDKHVINKTTPTRTSSWQPPPFGWVRVNTDGAVSASGSKAGCGSIVRDH